MIIRSRICYKVIKLCVKPVLHCSSLPSLHCMSPSQRNLLGTQCPMLQRKSRVASQSVQTTDRGDADYRFNKFYAALAILSSLYPETKSAPKSQGQDLNICRREHGGQGHVSRLYTVWVKKAISCTFYCSVYMLTDSYIIWHRVGLI